jgi:hypothetical protein
MGCQPQLQRHCDSQQKCKQEPLIQAGATWRAGLQPYACMSAYTTVQAHCAFRQPPQHTQTLAPCYSHCIPYGYTHNHLTHNWAAG